MNVITLFLVLISLAAHAQDTYKNVYTESAWTDRDRWQKANELMKYLGIKPGSHVADVGCHEGYMTVKLSSAVGENGRVYGVDVEQSKLDRLAANLEKRKITNVTPVKGDYDDPKLPLNSFDAVVIIDTYHEMNQHDKILEHIKASLKKGGRLVLCEPIAEERRESSRTDQGRKHELGMNFAISDLENAGFIITKRQDPFVDRTKEKGDVMWLIVAVKK